MRMSCVRKSMCCHIQIFQFLDQVVIGQIELSSAGLIDSSSIDSSIFGTKNYLEKNHSTDNENLYSNIDQLIKGASNDNKKK